MKTFNNGTQEIVTGEKYYFAELWDGEGNGEEILESNSIAITNENDETAIVEFTVVEEKDDTLETIVTVTSIMF